MRSREETPESPSSEERKRKRKRRTPKFGSAQSRENERSLTPTATYHVAPQPEEKEKKKEKKAKKDKRERRERKKERKQTVPLEEALSTLGAALERAKQGKQAKKGKGSKGEELDSIAHSTYMELREKVGDRPVTFHFRSAQLMRDAGVSHGVCLRVVSNTLEVAPPSDQATRSVAYFMGSVGGEEAALRLLRGVQTTAPEEPISYSDYALMKALWLRSRPKGSLKKEEVEGGMGEVVGNLVRVITGKWEGRFREIEWPAILLLTWCVDWAERVHGITGLWPEASLPAAEFRVRDLRPKAFVWLGWDTDHTDIDLHVREPSGEEVYYAHNRSGSGGHISRDFTDGYGPEVYVNVNAPPGEYTINTKYYGSHQASQATGGTSGIVWAVKHMGDPEKEELIYTTLRLSQQKELSQTFTLTV